MRHNKKGRKLGTDYSHTKAMKRSLVSALFLNDRIKTVESRAKEIRPQVDKVITWAKRGDLHSRRLAIAYLNDKELVREIFEKVAQGMFQDRPGGYTRIMKLGPRKGDNAPMVIMELVTEPCVPKAERKAAAEKKAATKKAAPKKVAKKADKSEELAEDLGFEADGTVEQIEAVDAAEADADNVAEIPPRPPRRKPRRPRPRLPRRSRPPRWRRLRKRRPTSRASNRSTGNFGCAARPPAAKAERGSIVLYRRSRPRAASLRFLP